MSSIRNWFTRSATWLRANAFWLWQATAFVVVVAYSIFVVRPFVGGEDPASKLEDVAASWNASVAKLGISPLFPPQENFFVGDLWAIISDSPDPSLIGKGVRVGHIDVSDAIRREQKSRSDFEAIFVAPQGSSQSNASIDGQARLFSLAFPILSIAKNEDRGASSSLPLIGLSSSRKFNTLSELEIPLASTYGAEAVEAILRFYEYCGDQHTHIRCTEKFARNLLSATVDERIAPVDRRASSNADPAASHFEVRLQLITRAYLTSSIVHKQVISGSALIEAKAGPARSNESESGSGISRQGGDSSDLSFNEKFERPLVFGFRSAIFAPLAE